MGADTPQLGLGAAADGALVVAVGGRATQRTCPTAERVVQSFLATAGEAPRIVLDVRGCEWIDSTFAGWMTQVAKRVSRAGGGLTVTGCGARCLTSLQRMHIDTLFKFEEDPPAADLRTIECATTDKPTGDELRLMLAAHEELAGVSDANRRVFQPIVDMLKAQIAGQG